MMSEYEIVGVGVCGNGTVESRPSRDEYRVIVRDVMSNLMRSDLGMPSIYGAAADCSVRVRAFVRADRPEDAVLLSTPRIRSAGISAGLDSRWLKTVKVVEADAPPGLVALA